MAGKKTSSKARQTAYQWHIPQTILQWPVLSGEAKLAALWFWNRAGGTSGIVELRLMELSRFFGRKQSGPAMQWLEELAEARLIDVEMTARGVIHVYVHDPDELARSHRKAIRMPSTLPKPKPRPPTPPRRRT